MFEQPVRYVAQPPPGQLDDATLLATARERAAHLAEASKQLAGSLNPDRTLRRALHVTVPALADWAQLMMPTRTGVRYTAVRTDEPDRFVSVDGTRPVLGEISGHGRILATGRAELMHVLADGVVPESVAATVPAGELRDGVLGLRPADLLVLPLTARGTTFGTLTLARRAGRGFEPEDVTFAQELTGRIAVALDTARVYAEQAQVAEVLAASLRAPQLPETPGIAIGTRMRAALHAAEIGGDFFDVFGEPGDWSVLLGDVAGKGAEAAILTGQARHTARGAAFYDRRPAELLRVLNASLFSGASRVEPTTRFLTAICARVRTAPDGSLSVVLASAGHPHPLVVRRSGTVEEVPVKGLLCGALPIAQYVEVGVELAPGDMMVLFTDGVPDAIGPGGRFGLGRLSQLAAGYAGSGPHALAEAIDIAVAEYSGVGVGPTDDVAVLAFGGVRQ
ncbi:PP2C family protein-serine/threonine phosphatase [Cryptosporangium aurantiacum]|uniref:Serine phosphatase n=1 Tax=Cryptosporangium aurantiacum TaxID=134849 RepID=A0A1M7NQH0_9ACTN|nr:SpoIIE family protein phosphatase [Cryptosporangium aurantiacum]SHN05627.1 serine phosphatase [Cryptosporangium aurantiacum]